MVANLMDSNLFSIYYLIILGLLVLTGVFVAKKLKVEDSDDWKSNGFMNAIISFFSLLLAFTLSSASNSNKERISLMHQHAEAISSLYRQSYFFDDSLHNSVKLYTAEFLSLKINSAKLNGVARKQYDEQAFVFNEKYLRSMIELARNNPKPPVGINAVIDDLNKIIDLDSQLHFSNQERTPTVVMTILLLVSWVVGFMVGLSSVLFKKRHYIGPVIFIVITSLTVLAIQDMDNPHEGLIRPPYDVYESLLAQIKNSN